MTTCRSGRTSNQGTLIAVISLGSLKRTHCATSVSLKGVVPVVDSCVLGK